MSAEILPAHVFRAYDIRGHAENDLHDPGLMTLAYHFGVLAKRHGQPRVALGRDARLSSPRVHRAVTEGLLRAGVQIEDCGLTSSPLLYWAVAHLDTGAGIQITASHNPKDDNGLKLVLHHQSFHGDDLQGLRHPPPSPFPPPTGAVQHHELTDAYLDEIAGQIKLGPHPKRIAIDGGNGMGGPFAMALMARLGVEASPLFIPPDGRFPNHHPDPTVESNLVSLRERVLSESLDLGVAYDGDADRIGVIDAQGDIIWGDRLLAFLARPLLREHPGATILGEVKCSQVLFEEIARLGGKPIMSAVGHSIIKDRMRTEGALLAGEMSGHIFYADRWYGFDDAIYVTARLLEILTQSPAPLHARLADLPETHSTPEIRMPCPDALKFQLVEAAIAHFSVDHEVITIDGARIHFDGGWGLIRASNTQPVLVLRAEAQSLSRLTELRKRLMTFVSQKLQDLHMTAPARY